MNEGYRLTDFTLEELSALNLAIDVTLKHASLSDFIKESLREQKVRILTAFSIVKEREKQLSN